jgi:hypothetical protein
LSGQNFERISQYLQRTERERDDFDTQILEMEIDWNPLDADDVDYIRDPLHEHPGQDSGCFETFCGFNLSEFDYLYSIVEMRLTVWRRGCQRVIGARDFLMLFLHWLRSGRGCMEIAHQFELCEATLYRTLHEIIDLVHDRFVDEFVGSHARDRFIAGRTSPTVAWWSTPPSSIAGVQWVWTRKPGNAFPENINYTALSRKWSRDETPFP